LYNHNLNKVNDELLITGSFRLVDSTAQVICDSKQDGEGEGDKQTKTGV